MHDDFGFWLEGTDADRQAQVMLEQANQAILPTERLGPRVRLLVRPEGSAPTCAGCCRSPRRRCSTRWRGCARRERSCSARAPGTPALPRPRPLVPVWDLPADTPAEDWVEPAAGVRRPGSRQALAATEPLNADERRARAGLLSRQITIR